MAIIIVHLVCIDSVFVFLQFAILIMRVCCDLETNAAVLHVVSLYPFMIGH